MCREPLHLASSEKREREEEHTGGGGALAVRGGEEEKGKEEEPTGEREKRQKQGHCVHVSGEERREQKSKKSWQKPQLPSQTLRPFAPHINPPLRNLNASFAFGSFYLSQVDGEEAGFSHKTLDKHQGDGCKFCTHTTKHTPEAAPLLPLGGSRPLGLTS